MWRYYRSKQPNIVLRKKNTAGAIRLYGFRLSLKATVPKTVWYWHENRHRDQWNRIESKNELNYNGWLIYHKGGKNTQQGKDSLFNKWCWENSSAACRRIQPDYSITLHTKINSKWIKDLNVKPETKTPRRKCRQYTPFKEEETF